MDSIIQGDEHDWQDLTYKVQELLGQLPEEWVNESHVNDDGTGSVISLSLMHDDKEFCFSIEVKYLGVADEDGEWPESWMPTSD